MTFKNLIDPLALAWLVLLAIVMKRLFRGRERRECKFLVLLLLVPVIELTRLPAWLVASLEAPYSQGGNTLPAGPFDAVVVCGGVLAGSPDDFAGADYVATVDRVLTGVEMARQLRLPLLLGGGASGGEAESVYLSRWLNGWNLVEGLEVARLGVCRDTRDEAVRTAALAAERGWKRILLVTSAWHMRRAAGAFRKTGLEVVTKGCDFEGTATLNEGRGRFLPSCASACLLRCWITESAGRFYYYCRGWL